MHPLSRLILINLTYSEVFNSALSLKNLHQWLPLQKTTLANLSKQLKILSSKKIIFKKDNHYSLIKSARIPDRDILKHKTNIAHQSAGILSRIPSVKMIAISGSVAAGNPGPGADIDLFIVSSSYSIWWTRLVCTLIMLILRRRRSKHSRHSKNKVCLNMFLEENNLKIVPENIYTAREVLQIVPIYNSDSVYEKFLHTNSWAFKIFPNFPSPPRVPITHRRVSLIRLLKPILWVIFTLQYLYMKKNITIETVKFDEIRFHPIDYQSKILKQFSLLLAKKNISLTIPEAKILIPTTLDKKN